ncbi:MAG: VWA domain-containing protein [Coriobacteriales bacterium]|jgi:uncharacterized protein YegL|nr:VWA domain-containing protein [Coriobacteriales bacterium]
MNEDSITQTGAVEKSAHCAHDNAHDDPHNNSNNKQFDSMAEVVFILDRSGSMRGREDDTIGGFNAMLDKQRQASGDAKLSTVLFDNEYELLHDRLDIDNISYISEEDYYVRGNTALLDAIGRSINKIIGVRKALAANKEQKTNDGTEKQNVTFIIITDGHENASHEFSADQIKKMIRHQEDKYGWEFIYLAANIDAVHTGEQYGIRPEYRKNYRTDKDGISTSYDAASDIVMMKRQAASRVQYCMANEALSWSKKLDAEFEKGSDDKKS